MEIGIQQGIIAVPNTESYNVGVCTEAFSLKENTGEDASRWLGSLHREHQHEIVDIRLGRTNSASHNLTIKHYEALLLHTAVPLLLTQISPAPECNFFHSTFPFSIPVSYAILRPVTCNLDLSANI